MNGTRVVGGIPANELQYRMLVSGPWESQLNRLFPKRSNGGRRARDGRLRAAPVLFVLLVCLFLLVGIPEGVPSAFATESAVECGCSIAVRLAPGARLAENPDGTIGVVRDWESLAGVEPVAPGLGLRETASLPRLGIRVLEPTESGASDVGVGRDLEAAAAAFRLTPGVVWAEVSRPLYACLTPNDPLYTAGHYSSVGQWGPPRVGLPAAWDITTGAADVVVAVLDSGLNKDIADFSGRIVSPYSALSRSSLWPAWQDTLGHGTAVAAVAAARGNDGQGMAGAAWSVKIMPVKISEAGESDTTILAAAIEYAVNQGADVINVSFSGRQTSQALTTAVAYALNHGVVVVAAAGNDGIRSVAYPAALPGVIAVGATTRTDERWPKSNQGTELDVVAPGSQILSYSFKSPTSFALWDGTSLSSPLVAGVAALMLSVDGSLVPEQVAKVIKDTADDLGEVGWDEQYGWGLLDAAEAVERARNHVTSTTTTLAPVTTTSTTATTWPTTTTTTRPPTSTTQPPTTTTSRIRFVDVSQATTSYSAEIDHLASLGIVSGSEDGLFRPRDNLVRQQFAKIIVRACGHAVTGTEISPFVDVAAQMGTDPFYPYCYVAVAYRQGITNGTDPTHFSPFGTLTRAQMVTMVARAAALKEPPVSYRPPFSKFSGVHYAPAVAAAYAGFLDKLDGMGPNYDFGAPATRGEVCAVVYALLQWQAE